MNADIHTPTLEERLTFIEQLEADLYAQREYFLRAAGWELSSSYPDSVWRWSKQVEGRQLSESRAEDAIRVEQCLMGA